MERAHVVHRWVSVLAVAAASLPGPVAGQGGPLDAVSFMAGTWCSPGGPGRTVIEEHYTTPSANLVLGTTRYLRDGAAVGHELSRIELDADGVVLTPMPSGQSPVPFRLTLATPGRAVFENPAHDFPVRIEYARAGDTLVARASGSDGGGPEWRMTPCPPDQPQAAPAEAPADTGARDDGTAVFERLAGSWEGRGTLFEAPARFTMRWDVADGLATLRFANALVADDGAETPILTAMATYRTVGTPEGVWLDTRGERIELTWTLEDGALRVQWRASTEVGRTTYRPRDDGAVEVVDEVSGPDGWRRFGRAIYARVEPGP